MATHRERVGKALEQPNHAGRPEDSKLHADRPQFQHPQPSVHGRTYTTLGLGRVAAKGLNRIEGAATSSAVGTRNTG